MAVLDYSQGIPAFFGCVLTNKLPYLLTKQAQRSQWGRRGTSSAIISSLHPSCTAEQNSPRSCCFLSTNAGYGWDNCVWDNVPNPILSAPCRVISMQILLAAESWQVLSSSRALIQFGQELQQCPLSFSPRLHT